MSHALNNLNNKENDQVMDQNDRAIDQNNQNNPNDQNNWQPSCKLEALIARAKMLSDIRDFFKARNVLEVETPLLCAHGVTAPHLHAISAQYAADFQRSKTYFLQTSPEFAMKRLLAAGSGSIYQLCKAFRNGERGQKHNPEFSILEWYRVGFDHLQLMDEMDEFLQAILQCSRALRFTYAELFLKYLALDPHSATLEELKNLSLARGINLAANEAVILSKDDWLDLLMTHCIEPELKRLGKQLEQRTSVMVYDYPASQAALAKIRVAKDNQPTVAERFEVYVDGVELANGYHELGDAEIQLQRFKADNDNRLARNLPLMAADMYLVQGLKAGFPSCAGVALGIDRLLMLQGNYQSIDEVLSFTIDRA